MTEPTEYERLRQVSPEDADLLIQASRLPVSFETFKAWEALARRLRELVEDQKRLHRITLATS
jgi:hypothetical protein